MAPATSESVAGRFDGRVARAGGEEAIFRREGDAFVVRLPGADGRPVEVEVRYTFGVEPLQQYLVPWKGGRLQVLPWAWDARPVADGGQRWFHLYADAPPRAGEPLHWTGRAQTWNTACAECHSTGLVRGYDETADAYDTTWAEIDVGCEACHGPGAEHVAWARAGADPRRGNGLLVAFGEHAEWIPGPATGIARRARPRSDTTEIETCALCHARREPLVEPYRHGRPILDSHAVALLDEGLYHADGQILDEVYVYGSFVQSRMHRAGVTCSDCHDPHALRLRAGSADAVCARCHAPARFAARAHHGHDPAGPGASCVACHMPERIYMGVDARRDHSFRIPRPDLARALGVPDACTACHADRDPAWAERALAGRGVDLGERRPHWGLAIDAGRVWGDGARAALLAAAVDDAVPPIARGTAVSLLPRVMRTGDVDAIARAARDADGLVRLGAARAAASLAPADRFEVGRLLAADDLRAVRVAVGRALAPLVAGGTADPGVSAAVADYRDALALASDRAPAWVERGALLAAASRLDEAERAYRRALELEPNDIGALANLADLRRLQRRDDEAMALLERAAAIAPDDAGVRLALGLALVRTGRRAEALEQLARAARLAPRRPDIVVAHALALHASGRTGEAIDRLVEAARRMPAHTDLRFTLATLLRDAGRLDEARRHTRALLELDPDAPRARALAASLAH